MTATIFAADVKLEIKRSPVETIAGASEVDHAIAKLVLAFGTDPVARWMYDDRMIICCTSSTVPSSGRARLKEGARNAPTRAMASRFGFGRAFAVTTVRSR